MFTRDHSDKQKSKAAIPANPVVRPANGTTLSDLPVIPQHVRQRRHNGLPDRLKTSMEAISGLSLEAVQVHYNSPKPAQLQALAYTQGLEIFVAPGQESHLPHEAWHVVQQVQGRVKPTQKLKKGLLINDDPKLEREADTMGVKAVHMSRQNLPIPIAVDQAATDEPNAHAQSKAQALVAQRYVAINNIELQATLARITSIADVKLKKLVKALRWSLPAGQALPDQLNNPNNYTLGEVKASLTTTAGSNQAVAFRPPAAAPPGVATQPWNEIGAWNPLGEWWSKSKTLGQAVDNAKARIRAARQDASISIVFPGAENRAGQVMTQAADHLDTEILWQRDQGALGLTSPGQMYVQPLVINTLVANPNAWENGQKVLQHEAFHLVNHEIVDAFYRPATPDPDLWHRFLAKSTEDKLRSAPHFEEVVASSQGNSNRPAAAPHNHPGTLMAQALDDANEAMHWGWTSAVNAASDVSSVHTADGTGNPLPLNTARLVLFISIVEGLGYHHRLKSQYLQQVAAGAAAPPAKNDLLIALHPDSIDRDLAERVSAWLNPLYGRSMRRKYNDPPDPAINVLGTREEMRDQFIRRELEAVPPFKKDRDRDFNLVLDLQAGRRNKGPRAGVVTIESIVNNFLASF